MISAAVNKKIRTYKGLVQLAVTADFPLGSITKIYGPSGAGKTTFLKILAGLTSPEQGSISFEQEVWLDTEKQINQTPQQRKVGFVFQDYALFPNMTVLQHLEYASTESDFILRLLKLGQMEAFQQHRPKHLSGGQQQRLAILRALATKPRLLLMDEAFSALDDDLRQNLITGLKPLLEEFGTTTIIVSHHAEETAGFANRDLKID